MVERQHNRDRADRIRSQKAAALLRYEDHFNRSYEVPRHTMVLLLDDEPKHIRDWFMRNQKEEAFLRTAPLTPRHGVLESTKIRFNDFLMDWARLRNSMLELDPEGCLILQPFIDADYSAVMAPGKYAVIGQGHDGITAGHGLSITLPLKMGHRSLFYNLKGLNFDPDMHEIEFVSWSHWVESDHLKNEQNGFSTYLTQIRGAENHVSPSAPPEGVSVNGIIPDGRIDVMEVFEATGLEQVAWLEEFITKDKVPNGFVVSEPNGSLLSHICAHCRAHSIPYVIGHVEVGDSWVEPASGWVVNDPDYTFTANPYDPSQYATEFRAGVQYANQHWQRQFGWLATFFHQWASMPMSDPKVVAYLAGVFAGWIVKAVFAISAGEMRHSMDQNKTHTPDIPVFLHAVLGDGIMEEVTVTSNPATITKVRRHYYAGVQKIFIEDFRQVANLLDYMRLQFRTNWCSSYGGPKWADGAKHGRDAARALADFLDGGDYEQVLASINSLENCVHNTGHLFNKFLQKAAFDYATGGFPDTRMNDMVKVYAIAKHIIEDEPLVTATYKSEADLKYGMLYKWLKKNKHSHQRQHPIFEGMEMDTVQNFHLFHNQPNFIWPSLRAVVESSVMVHPNTGNHAMRYPKKPEYVPCGMPHCSSCKQHFQEEVEVKGTITTAADATIDLNNTTPVDTEKMAVFILDGEVKQTPSTSFLEIQDQINKDAQIARMYYGVNSMMTGEYSALPVYKWCVYILDKKVNKYVGKINSAIMTDAERQKLGHVLGSFTWLVKKVKNKSENLAKEQGHLSDADDDWVEPEW